MILLFYIWKTVCFYCLLSFLILASYGWELCGKTVSCIFAPHPSKRNKKWKALVIQLLHCSTPRLLFSLSCLFAHFIELAGGKNTTTKKLGVAARKTHNCVWQFLLADSLQTSECHTPSLTSVFFFSSFAVKHERLESYTSETFSVLAFFFLIINACQRWFMATSFYATVSFWCWFVLLLLFWVIKCKKKTEKGESWDEFGMRPPQLKYFRCFTTAVMIIYSTGKWLSGTAKKIFLLLFFGQ